MKKTRLILIPFFIFLIVYKFFYNQNSKLTKSTYEINDSQIPLNFSNYKIVVISDLHNKSFGKNNVKLLKEIRVSSPDLIVVTGDLINIYSPNKSVALNFIKEAKIIAPVYFVSGNHEIRLTDYTQFEKELNHAGAIVLDNIKTKIKRGNDYINLLGLADPNSYCGEYRYLLFAKKLDHLIASVGPTDFTILLSHRPELMHIYAIRPINLVLAGHAHGGQFRLPFLGGVFSPNQGFFPDFSAGKYTKSGTLMIVSRGLGPSSFPLRLNNKPDLVEIILNNSF